MKKIIIAAAVGLLVAGQVAAQESPWLVRARAVNVNWTNHNSVDAFESLSATNKTIPEVDISYFFNKNVAAELILTVPQQVNVVYKGGDVGTFKALPPTLTLQYHFTDFVGYKPYVGAGVNFTKITHPNLLSGDAGLDDHSYGFALQAGVDVPLTKQVSLNFDVKKVQIQSDVYSSGAKAGTLKLDPVLVGVGVGYRF
jgi:outer membrane protein